MKNQISTERKVEEKELQIGELVSEGNFGIVYKAQIKNTNFAVKKTKGSEAEFEREIHFVSVLPPHPNIVTFVGSCKHTKLGHLMIVEWMDGGDLLSVLQSTNLTLDQKIECCMQICRGLEHLHASEIIHRDLAARNVMVFLLIIIFLLLE